ncbi:cysteine-rich secreted protein [Macrophomina phaseolina MS6]|uniref:Cysteine-rich secreted protein n=1 Tax=Macrophomina phaseolina (strain MS6) TaxID=1126212 RepID=K2S162_MACPH|nr:cysteine-rich secreted protein [Macrophomina phaseolina MS6]
MANALAPPAKSKQPTANASQRPNAIRACRVVRRCPYPIHGVVSTRVNVGTGKCYTFTAENGERYGYDDRVGYGYVPRAHDVHHRFGKFQLCSDQACTAGLPIDPDTSFRIRDIHGSFNADNAMQWLDNSSNGGHIGKTPSWERAGVFSLTRWPCGKYCWGGFEQGLGPTCPAEAVGVTLYTQDKNICVPITITEVPCDIKSLDNNCIWRSGADQCCSPMDCTNRDAKKDA